MSGDIDQILVKENASLSAELLEQPLASKIYQLMKVTADINTRPIHLTINLSCQVSVIVNDFHTECMKFSSYHLTQT